jgi:hypothetical protein
LQLSKLTGKSLEPGGESRYLVSSCLGLCDWGYFTSSLHANKEGWDTIRGVGNNYGWFGLGNVRAFMDYYGAPQRQMPARDRE